MSLTAVGEAAASASTLARRRLVGVRLLLGRLEQALVAVHVARLDEDVLREALLENADASPGEPCSMASCAISV